MMRMPLLLVLGIALLSACTAAPPTPTAAPTLAPRPAPPDSVAADLSGTWTITDVETAKVGTIEFTPGAFIAQLPCGELSGSWLTAGDAWLGMQSFVEGGCASGGVPWLTSTVGIVRVGETWTLVDIEGATTATLIDGISSRAPADSPGTGGFTAAPLDPMLSVGPLEGRWQVGNLYVEFHESSWRLSGEGRPCSGGRFVEVGDGYVLSLTPDITGSIACVGLDIRTAVSAMRTAGFDGDELVIFDAEGAELMRFLPASDGWVPCEPDKRDHPRWQEECKD